MRKVWAIAGITFKEAKRDRILYLLFFFAAVAILASRVLAILTVGDRVKIIKDVGLASIQVFGVLMAVLIGTSLVYKEIDKKTIFTLLSKPLHRAEFILGKFLGLVLTLFVMTGGHGPDLPRHRRPPHLPHRGSDARRHRLHLPRARPRHRRGHPLLLVLDAHPELDLLPRLLSHRPSLLGPRAPHQAR